MEKTENTEMCQVCDGISGKSIFSHMHPKVWTWSPGREKSKKARNIVRRTLADLFRSYSLRIFSNRHCSSDDDILLTLHINY